MKTIHYKYLVCALFLMTLVYSCKKDTFLNRLPVSKLTEQNFFNNANDLQTYCNGLYSFEPSIYIALQDEQSDNYENNPFNHVVAGQIVVPTSASQAEWQVTAGSAGWSWGYLRSVNYFLQHYQKATAPEAIKNHYAGIAHFFRAWFYFEKVKQYGDVPFYESAILPNDSANLFKGRDPRALVMDSVMADMSFAVNNIQETGPSGTITKWAALSLMARISLHEGTFRKYHGMGNWQPFLKTADSAANAIIAGGKYKLYSTGMPEKDYRNLFLTFTPGDAQNVEIILSRTYSNDLHTTYPLDGYLSSYGHGITKSLINTYLMKDGTPFTSMAGSDTMMMTSEFTNRDPRLRQTYLGPMDSIINPTNNAVDLTGANRLGASPTGYQQIKYYDPSTPGWNTNFNSALIFRYAEVLLIHAEAKAELANGGVGSFNQADLDQTINLLRDRVGMPHLLMSAPNDPVLQARYPNVTGGLANIILEIRRERRVELACEGLRYDDLMRWKAGALLAQKFVGEYFPHLGAFDLNKDGNIDVELVNTTPTKPYQKQVGVDVFLSNGNSGNIVPYPSLNKTFDESKNYYFPLPETELLLNKKLTQNPNWAGSE